jgi:hypothetical protein
MPEAVKKNAQWTPVVTNTRAIRGAIDACLKLSDQLSDPELKGEAMGFVNEMEYLAAQLLVASINRSNKFAALIERKSRRDAT